MAIPLSVPNISGNEWKYIKECLDTNWVSSVGSFVDKFEQSIAKFTGAKYAISTVNGTAALHTSLILSGVEQNDYVILPNVTFIASANSIRYVKADPILIDIDANTWQMDLDILEDFLINKTFQKANKCCYLENNRIIKAVMPVHILGNMCDMERLMNLADKFNFQVIEDATESLGSYFKRKHSGTFGTLGCFSFNGNKIITTGGGGIIVTDNEALAKRAKHITTQAKSDAFEYIHDEIGYNYRMVNILAAMGVAQMEQLPDFLKRKQHIFLKYKLAFQHINCITPQYIENSVEPNYWLQTFKFKDSKKVLETLISNNIQVRPFWKPMNQLEMFKSDIYVNSKDVSNSVYVDCISLPCSTNITDEEINQVIECILNFYK